MAKALLDSVTGDSTGSSARLKSDRTLVYVAGLSSGGSIQVQASPNAALWVDVDGLNFTSDGVKELNLAPGAYVRAVATGVTAASAIIQQSEEDD